MCGLDPKPDLPCETTGQETRRRLGGGISGRREVRVRDQHKSSVNEQKKTAEKRGRCVTGAGTKQTRGEDAQPQKQTKTRYDSTRTRLAKT